jgi:hypothetical protein
MNSYLQRQAAVLLAMSRDTIDLGMAGRLRNLAADFEREAAKPAECDPPEAQPSLTKGKVGHFGPMD